VLSNFLVFVTVTATKYAKARVFVPDKFFWLSIIFVNEEGAYPRGRLAALPANI
jgi:hypothetical protein